MKTGFRHLDGGRVLVLVLACVLLGISHAPAQVKINEVMADNQNAVAYEGAFPDWIELYNTSTVDVNLEGWSLTDNSSGNTPFLFPSHISIPGGKYLVVWCDGLTNAPGLHTGWNLSRGGETISLQQGTAVKDSIQFGLQVPNMSIGRSPNGDGEFQLNRPTPGALNARVITIIPDQIKINEWMADPSSGDDWFELYNPAPQPVSLTGLFFSDRTNTLNQLTNRPMPKLSFMPAQGYVRLWADDHAEDGADQVDFKLGSGGDRIVIFNTNQLDIIDRVDFGAQSRGQSQGRLPDGNANIVTFVRGRETPEESNFQLLTNIVINEVLAHSDPPLEDAIELYNPTAAPVDISHWWLSDSRDDPKKFRIPENTIVPAGGYKVFYEYQFNPDFTGTNRSFTLSSAHGDEVYLYTASNNLSGTLTGYRTSREFGPTENGVSLGRYVNAEGNTDFVPLSRLTFGTDVRAGEDTNRITLFRQGQGAPNAMPKLSPVVISEIMYHPPNIQEGTNSVDNSVDEFVEIQNTTSAPMPLYDTNRYAWDGQIWADGWTNAWRLRGVVDFDFPTNLTLPPYGQLLLVNFDPATETNQLKAFRTLYQVNPAVPIFGPYSGKLANNEGSVELYRPDVPQNPTREDAGFVPYLLMDRVRYADRAPWSTNADGRGFSLQRENLTGYGNDFTNWIAAVPSAGVISVASNAAPVLGPLTDVTVDEFRLVTFTAAATDDATPAHQLYFSLGPGAPARASISAGGEFRWRPVEADGPGTYEITVRVMDAGTPAMSDEKKFQVTVNEVNQRPVLSMREQWIVAGTSLTFKTGYDFDRPAQALSFSLGPDTPAGLVIDPTNGWATWAPPADLPAGVYHATVNVVDNGAPALTNSFTYTIHVMDSAFELVWMDEPEVKPNGDIVLRWAAPPRDFFSVSYVDDLLNMILADQIPVSEPVLILHPPYAAPAQFYQVIIP